MRRVGPAGHSGGGVPRRHSRGPSEDEPLSHQSPGSVCRSLLESTPHLGRSQVSGLPGGSMLDNPPTMGEAWVPSLGREDPLEEGMATPSRTVVWRIPWTEEPGGLQSTGSQRVRCDSVT